MKGEPSFTPASLAISSLPQGKVGDKGSLGFPGPPGPEVRAALFLWLQQGLGSVFGKPKSRDRKMLA